MKRLLMCALVALSLMSVLAFGRWHGRWGGRWGRRVGPRFGLGYRRPWAGVPFWGSRYHNFGHYCRFHPNDYRCLDYYGPVSPRIGVRVGF